MKILVSGASGMIGGALCRRLLDDGHTMVALSRDPGAARRLVPELVQVFPWAPLTGEPSPEAFAGVDAVVHLAGESVSGRMNPAKKRAILDSRERGTRHLVAAMERLEIRPRVLISASATGWYGDRGDDLLSEEASPGLDFMATVCRRWEKEATAAELLGVRVVRLRMGWVLSPKGGFLGPMLLLYRLGLGGTLGSGQQWWSWIHLADLTRLVAHVLEQPVSGVLNATAPESVRQREFAGTLGRVMRRPALLPAPAFVLKLVLGELAQEVLASKRVLPHRAQESGFHFQYPALEAALQDVLRR